MGRLVALEAFDRPAPVPEPAGPGADWQAGHAAGLADGLEMAAARQAVLGEEVVQSITDLTFTYAEARAQVLASLRPLLRALLDRLLPGIVPETLRAAILEALAQAAEADSRLPLVLRVHPSNVAPLERLLATLAERRPGLVGEQDLGKGQALLDAAGAETLLDIDGLLEAIRQSLAAVTEDALKEVCHG